jgi:hypothetical protein
MLAIAIVRRITWVSNFIEHIELTWDNTTNWPFWPHKRKSSQIRFLAPPQTTITNFKPTARIKSTLRARNPEREHTIPTNPTKPPRPKGIQSPKKLTHTASDGASGVGVDLPWRASSSTGTAAHAAVPPPRAGFGVQGRKRGNSLSEKQKRIGRKRGKREGARLLRFAGDPARVSIHTMEASESSAEWMGWEEPLALSPLLGTAVFFTTALLLRCVPSKRRCRGVCQVSATLFCYFRPIVPQSQWRFLSYKTINIRRLFRITRHFWPIKIMTCLEILRINWFIVKTCMSIFVTNTLFGWLIQ